MNVIRRIRRECFRYRLSGAALMACLVLSMVAAYYGVAVYKNIYTEHREKVKYKYQYVTYFTCYVDDISELPRLPEGVECNLKIIDYSVYSDAANSTQLINVIINSYEENWPLASGHFANEYERSKGENIVVLGQGRKDDTYTADGGRYYKLFGDSYRVIGTIGTPNSVAYDYYTVLYLDCLGEQAGERLIADHDNGVGIYFALESNTVNTDDIFEQYIAGNYNALRDNEGSYVDPTAAPIYDEKAFCITIYAFCFVCISIVVRFWLEQRKKEMQVCRAFGFSNGQIVRRLAGSFGCIMAASAVPALICWFILGLVMGKAVDKYRLGFSWTILLPYILVLISSVVLVSFKSVYVFLKKSIVENV